MGWWITLGILVLLAVLPLGILVCYDAEGPLIRAVIGPLKLKLYPRPKKEKKKKEAQASSEEHAPQTEEPQQTVPEKPLPKPPQPPREKTPEKKKLGGSLTDFFPFVKLGLDFLGDLRRKLRVKELYLRLIMTSSDPCDLAVNYGKTWSAVGNLIPALERWFVIKKRDVEVECDFTASETKVIARLEITLTLGRLLSLAAVYGFRGLKEFLTFRNKRKGGAEK